MLLGLDKDLSQPIAGYWGLAIAPDSGISDYQTADEIKPVYASADVTGQSFAPVISTPAVVAPQQVTTTSTADTITAIGNVAAAVIDAVKGNAQPIQNIVAPSNNNVPTPTTDNGKKTSTILWIVGGVVAVVTLLYLAFKKRN